MFSFILSLSFSACFDFKLNRKKIDGGELKTMRQSSGLESSTCLIDSMCVTTYVIHTSDPAVFNQLMKKRKKPDASRKYERKRPVEKINE